ncbi:hypothetical protein [Vibrio sp. MEBiC08052]|uniref:hypothetical protein n=1 Tax=Vibrio sp. MEBiC08052 TaxID=1761910 RepID=UPI0012FBD328|nr:hypothetical protein [Vibrio sp. MEBiC08052]
MLTEDQVAFRNNVIHKGKIPSKDEAIKYGQNVMDIIRPMLIFMKDKKRRKYLSDVTHKMNKERWNNVINGEDVSKQKLSSIRMTLGLHYEPLDQRSLEEIVSSRLNDIYMREEEKKKQIESLYRYLERGSHDPEGIKMMLDRINEI